jgi:hypothetical protein
MASDALNWWLILSLKHVENHNFSHQSIELYRASLLSLGMRYVLFKLANLALGEKSCRKPRG